MKRSFLLVLLCAWSVAACSSEVEAPAGNSPYPLHLSDWGLFEGTGATQIPAEGVVPYQVASTLFADFSSKHRFIRLPEGGRIGYDNEAVWDFPVGTVLVKTFSYLHDLRDPSLGEDIVETRLIIREEAGWNAITYLWNAEETEASRVAIGASVHVEWTDMAGALRTLEYRVPTNAQCRTCHGGSGAVTPLALRTRQMDRLNNYGSGDINQIDHMATLGMFDVAPPAESDRPNLVDPFGAGDLDARVRSYFDANCAHCHHDGGAASASGLWLNWEQQGPQHQGVCKRPPAAGPGTCDLDFDIVPGDPEHSIMICRVASEVPDIKMPELPTQLHDPAGLALLTEWIAAMPADNCE